MFYPNNPSNFADVEAAKRRAEEMGREAGRNTPVKSNLLFAVVLDLNKRSKLWMMIAGLFLLSGSYAGAASADSPQPIQLMLNGKYIDYPLPINENGRILIPIRAVSEGLHATVRFKGADQPVVIELGKDALRFTPGKPEAFVNGRTVRLDVPAQAVDDTIYVPVRMIAEGLNTDVEWSAEAKVVVVESKPAAGTQALDVKSAQSVVHQEIGSSASLQSKGIRFLRFHSFEAYDKKSSRSTLYLVDKYSGELFTYDPAVRDMQNLTRAKVFKLVQNKVEPIIKSMGQMPFLEEYSADKTINGEAFYSFDISYSGTEGPVYITTVYASKEAARLYMLDAGDRVVAFSETSFQKLMQDE